MFPSNRFEICQSLHNLEDVFCNDVQSVVTMSESSCNTESLHLLETSELLTNFNFMSFQKRMVLCSRQKSADYTKASHVVSGTTLTNKRNKQVGCSRKEARRDVSGNVYSWLECTCHLTSRVRRWFR